jgi:hypothetical protein
MTPDNEPNLQDELDELRKQVAYERSEREALQKLVLEPLKEARSDAETALLRTEYLDERLADIRNRPRSDGDDEPTEVMVEVYQALLDLANALRALRERVGALEAGRLSDLTRDEKTLAIIVHERERLSKLINALNAERTRAA